MRIIGLVALLALAGLLPACSAMKIAYNQASELAYWQLDGYFYFDDAQTPKVRQELARLHQWHRQTQMPAYIDALQKWQAWLPGELDEAQACDILSEVRGKLLAISGRGEMAAAALVGTLAPEQLNALKRRFSKLNADYRSNFLDGKPQALFEKRYKKAVSRAEMLYGALEDKQLAVIRSRLGLSVFDAGISLAEQQRRQRDALRTLTPLVAGQSTAEQATPVLRAYFDRALNSPDPTYRRYQDKLMRDTCQTFAALHNSTSAVQRAKAVQTLMTYAQDFKILAAQGY